MSAGTEQAWIGLSNALALAEEMAGRLQARPQILTNSKKPLETMILPMDLLVSLKGSIIHLGEGNTSFTTERFELIQRSGKATKAIVEAGVNYLSSISAQRPERVNSKDKKMVKKFEDALEIAGEIASVLIMWDDALRSLKFEKLSFSPPPNTLLALYCPFKSAVVMGEICLKLVEKMGDSAIVEGVISESAAKMLNSLYWLGKKVVFRENQLNSYRTVTKEEISIIKDQILPRGDLHKVAVDNLKLYWHFASNGCLENTNKSIQCEILQFCGILSMSNSFNNDLGPEIQYGWVRQLMQDNWLFFRVALHALHRLVEEHANCPDYELAGDLVAQSGLGMAVLGLDEFSVDAETLEQLLVTCSALRKAIGSAGRGGEASVRPADVVRICFMVLHPILAKCAAAMDISEEHFELFTATLKELAKLWPLVLKEEVIAECGGALDSSFNVYAGAILKENLIASKLRNAFARGSADVATEILPSMLRAGLRIANTIAATGTPLYGSSLLFYCEVPSLVISSYDNQMVSQVDLVPLWNIAKLLFRSFAIVAHANLMQHGNNANLRVDRYFYTLSSALTPLLSSLLRIEFPPPLPEGSSFSFEQPVLSLERKRELSGLLMIAMHVLEKVVRHKSALTADCAVYLVSLFFQISRYTYCDPLVFAGHSEEVALLKNIAMNGPWLNPSGEEGIMMAELAGDIYEPLSAPKDTSTEAAKERTRILATLPCSYVGCTTVPKAGKEKFKAQLCGCCRVVRYCSIECQKKDWSEHKLVCKLLGTE